MEMHLPSIEDVIQDLGLGYGGKTQLLVTQTARDYMRPYVPVLNNVLRNSAVLVDGNTAVEYRTPYAHYQYVGEKYIDPVLGIAGFYTEEDGWKSRRGVIKVPSGEPLRYSNPMASARWDKKMIQERGSEFERSLQRALDLEFKK